MALDVVYPFTPAPLATLNAAVMTGIPIYLDLRVWHRNWIVSRQQELAVRQEALATSGIAGQLVRQGEPDRRTRREPRTYRSGSQQHAGDESNGR